MDVKKTTMFRANVRRFCHQSGITQCELAHRAKLSEQWLSRMLSGRSNPTLPVCERIAIALDTSLEALLADAPDTTSFADSKISSPIGLDVNSPIG